MSVFALAIELDGEGGHPAAWRRANHPPSESLSAKTLLTKVRAAENAGFILVTFEDSILPPNGGIRGRVDAVNRASFVAALLAIAVTVSSTVAAPAQGAVGIEATVARLQIYPLGTARILMVLSNPTRSEQVFALERRVASRFIRACAM